MVSIEFTTEDLKGMPLENRFLICMIQEKREVIYSEMVIQIIREKGMALGKCDTSHIQMFEGRMETAYHTYSVVKKLYKSMFDDLERQEGIIKEIAEEYAEKDLIRYGWKGEGK